MNNYNNILTIILLILITASLIYLFYCVISDNKEHFRLTYLSSLLPEYIFVDSNENVLCNFDNKLEMIFKGSNPISFVPLTSAGNGMYQSFILIDNKCNLLPSIPAGWTQKGCTYGYVYYVDPNDENNICSPIYSNGTEIFCVNNCERKNYSFTGTITSNPLVIPK